MRIRKVRVRMESTEDTSVLEHMEGRFKPISGSSPPTKPAFVFYYESRLENEHRRQAGGESGTNKHKSIKKH